MENQGSLEELLPNTEERPETSQGGLRLSDAVGSNAQYRSVISPEAVPARYRETASFFDAFAGAFSNNFATWSIIRDIDRLIDIRRDESWDADNEETVRELFDSRGLPIVEGHARRLRGSVSREHAERILDRIEIENQNSADIASFFYDNTGGSLTFQLIQSMFDPAGYVAGGVAGRAAGMGLKARAMANVSRAAMTGNMAAGLAPVTGRGTYALRNALAAAAADGTLEAYHISRSPTSGMEEAGIAALGSAAMAGVYGALGFRGAQTRLIHRAAIDHRNAVQSEFDAFMERPTAPVSDIDAGSSVGAARLSGMDEAPSTVEVDPLVEEFDPGQDAAFGNRTRIDAFAHMVRSASSSVRALASMIFEDGAATLASRGKAQHHTVEMLSALHERVFSQQYGRTLLSAYDEYKKAAGINTIDSGMNAHHYNQFITQVARAVRGDPTVEVTPAIAKARDAFRRSMREQLAKAKELGILEDVDVNDLYVPRFWRRDAFLQVMKDMGEENGRAALVRVIGRSLANKGTDVEEATSIAEHVVRIITAQGTNNDLVSGLRNMSEARAAQKIKSLLGEDVDESVLNSLVAFFSDTRKRAADGPRAERRLDLDENASVIVGGRRIRLDDLLNNDLLSVNTIYSRQIGGRIAFAEVTGGRLKTTNDIENFLAKAEEEVSLLDNAEKAQELQRIARMKAYADYLMGHGSLVDDVAMSEDTQAFLKFMRDLSFARLMGQVGYAQMSEVGTAIGALGFRAFLAQAPRAFRKVMDDYRPGVSDSQDNLIRVTADLTALGDMHIQSRIRTLSRELDSDDMYGARDTAPGHRGDRSPAQVGGKFMGIPISDRTRELGSKAGRAAELFARGTSILGGLSPITDFTQFAVVNALLAQFARNARNGDGLNRHVWGIQQNPARLLAMGIDDEWSVRITEMLNEVAEFDNGNLTALRIEKATDQAAVDHLFRSLYRESRRLVQEGDLGTANATMAHPLVRTLLQFKTFVINAHVKQMLYGLNMRDAQLASEFLMSFLFAGLGQMAKYNLMTLGMGPENRQDYLEYAFGSEGEERYLKVMASALRYSSQVGLAPDVMDTLTQMTLGERFFDYRNTGLSSGFFDLEAAAMFNTIKAPFQPINELAQGEPDDAVRDAFRIGPNYTPLIVLGNIMQEQTPKSFESQRQEADSN